MAAASCIHGFAPGTCLICATLGAAPAVPAAAAGGASATTTRRRPKAELAANAPVPAANPARAVERAPRLHLGLAGTVVAVAVVLLLAWWLIGLVWGLLHVVELVAVGVGCLVVGYKTGVVVGRRQHR